MLICIYIYSHNAIRLWYKLYGEPIFAYAFPVPLPFASHLLSPTARERGSEPTITSRLRNISRTVQLNRPSHLRKRSLRSRQKLPFRTIRRSGLGVKTVEWQNMVKSSNDRQGKYWWRIEGRRAGSGYGRRKPGQRIKIKEMLGSKRKS
jgi:hypothetical protein